MAMVYLLLSFASWIILINAEEADYDSSEISIAIYHCNGNIFLIESMDFAADLVHYLNLNIEPDDKFDTFESQSCDLTGNVNNVPSGMDLEIFAVRWIQASNKTSNATIYLYAQSLSRVNIYQVPTGGSSDDEKSDYHDLNKLDVEGCIIGLEDGDKNLMSTLDIDYVRISQLEKYKDVDKESLCSHHINELKLNTEVYSRYNGLPIVFVPGLISSQLFYQLKNATNKTVFASSPAHLWLKPDGLIKLLELATETTWLNDLKMMNHYDGTSDVNHNTYVGVGNWAHPESVRKFDDPRFEQLTSILESWGYEAGKSIRAAPYDFRQAPDEAGRFMTMLKNLIEVTYASNQNKRIVLFAHSMGNLFSLYFLNRQSQEWKDKYIHSFVCVAAPWYGSTSALKFLLRGEIDSSLSFLVQGNLKPIAQTWKSVLFLLPNEKLYAPSFPIIRTPLKSYTVMDYEQLLKDVGLEKMIPAYQRVRNLTKSMMAPNVEVHCLYGFYPNENNTDFYYSFPNDGDFPNYTMNTIRGVGDKTVNLESAKACLQWNTLQRQRVHEKAFVNVEHSEVLKNQEMFSYLKQILFKL